jgi:hypothetical protein
VARPHDGEVPAVEGGDPDGATPFSQCDHGSIRAAQAKVRVSSDQLVDAFPVVTVEVSHFKLPVDDGGLQAGFGLGAKLAVDQVSSIRDDQTSRDQRPGVPSGSALQAAWSLSARSAVASNGPVSTTST